MASIHEVDGGWKVRWNEGGRGGRSRSVTLRSEREATRKKLEIEDSLDRHGRYEPRRAGRATAVGLILVDFIKYSARKHAPGTTRNYSQYLELFKKWVGPNTGADALSYQLLSDYHTHLSNPTTGRHLHRRGPATVHKHFSAIELAWNFAWRRQARGEYHGVPQPDSLELQRPPRPTKRAPTWAQMDAMIACSEGWHRKLYIVMRCTGLRVGQVMRLRWDDLHEDGRDGFGLHIRPELGKMPQEKRGRWVPVAPVLAQEIAGWGVRDGWLVECPRKYTRGELAGQEHREARARDAQRAWTRADVDAAVWTGCAHHAFRAGFVSGLARAGADREAVEFLVGHSRGIREAYADPDALPLLEAVRRVPPLAVGTALVQPDHGLRIAADGAAQ